MVYVTSPVPSTVIPYVVQIFGVLQWTSKPVLFAKIIQMLDTATGIRLNEALKITTSSHLAHQLDNRS
ncbi:jg23807 [Pararge aegeria aegeria]|uniref:Jg23807 protein n=2 Tax=Pararge aegeria TaxID=116150 RepID=A0A8S4SL81_9NEOP|nr:jg23807 [Pararge aegeria aegeria]